MSSGRFQQSAGFCFGGKACVCVSVNMFVSLPPLFVSVCAVDRWHLQSPAALSGKSDLL